METEVEVAAIEKTAVGCLSSPYAGLMAWGQTDQRSVDILKVLSSFARLA